MRAILSLMILSGVTIFTVSGCGKSNSTANNNNQIEGLPCTQVAKRIEQKVAIEIDVAFGENSQGTYIEYLENSERQKPIGQVMCHVKTVASTPTNFQGFRYIYDRLTDQLILPTSGNPFVFKRTAGESGGLEGAWMLASGHLVHEGDRNVIVHPKLIFTGGRFKHVLTCEKIVSGCQNN